ncbi:MAG: LruC domain-containing protein [Bacteroidota bacterium]|nr:LruC domain-containing protein [Bacteroidota bacterium]
MKTIIKTIQASLVLVALFAFTKTSQAVTITKTNGMGYTTTIESVVNNCNNTYTISLILTHNGCSGSNCQALSHLSIEAAPGTYSAISRTVLSGGFTYGSLIMGPSLGSDPFQGFKFDNTGNIGNGVAGSVRITYTIAGPLQQQRLSAKAGSAENIVTFTVADFTYVMTNNNTNCNQNNNQDTDGDGCIDAEDAFPNDAARCAVNYKTGTLAYEDLWPSKGDYDFNDMVVEYTFTSVTNASNKVIDIKAEFTVLAFGAGFRNGFGFQLPNAINQAHLSVTGMQISGNIVSLGSNGLENAQSKPTFIVFDNNYSIMQHPGTGIGVNTTPGAPYVTPATVTLNISVQPNTYTLAQLGLANFNPFIFVNQVRSHEVHLPNFAPTSLMNMSLFGTANDASNVAQNKYYVTENNIPWAIQIPEEFNHPKEKVDIIQTHLKFKDWAESNGTLFTDWYKNLPGYRNTNNIY